ncbi:hypothetical protein N7467_004666 [Penicillium canescens]|nr:hypothetical protein N7467_004666 [Penicillium canescens]
MNPVRKSFQKTGEESPVEKNWIRESHLPSLPPALFPDPVQANPNSDPVDSQDEQAMGCRN